jgi:hypothetical protein
VQLKPAHARQTGVLKILPPYRPVNDGFPSKLQLHSAQVLSFGSAKEFLNCFLLFI